MMGLMGCGNDKTEETCKEKTQEPEKLVLWSYYETKAQQEGLEKLVRAKCSGMLNASLTFYTVLLTLSSASQVFPICSSDTLVK